MKICVLRTINCAKETISIVNINNSFFCFGLEDVYRPVKVAGETRIPEGTYTIGVRKFGGFHKRYSNKFSGLHFGMLEILNVPNFKHILIHIGNNHKDTAGCLLLGYGVQKKGGSVVLTYSKDAYLGFYNKVIDSCLLGNVSISFGSI